MTRLAFACAWLVLAAAAHAEAPLETTVQSGPVRLSVSVEPAAPRVGDTLTVRIRAEAEAGVDLRMPEFGRSLERFRILDFVPETSVSNDGATSAVHTYTLELGASGKQMIPPVLIEFVDLRDGHARAPDGEDAYELRSERVPFEVASVVPEPAAAELAPPAEALAIPREVSPYWYAAAGALVLLVGAAAAVYFIRRDGERERRDAYQSARARLDALIAKGKPRAEQVDPFFVELTAIVRRYLEDRFGLRAPELTTEEFLAVAGASPDLRRDHKALLREFLQRADMVKFAGVVPVEADIDSALGSASRFLDDTRPSVEGEAARVV